LLKYVGHLFGKNKFAFLDNKLFPLNIIAFALFQSFCPLSKLGPSFDFMCEFILKSSLFFFANFIISSNPN